MVPYSNLTHRLRRGTFALVAIVVTQCAFAQQVTSTAKRAVGPKITSMDKLQLNNEKSANNSKDGSEGITIHGHWTIEIKNPDGKLVEHREFENALVGDGSALLASLLLGQTVVGDYTVVFGEPYNDVSQVCGNPGICYLVTSLSSLGGSYCKTQPGNICSVGLTVIPVIGTHPRKPVGLTLAGQTTALNAGNIAFVGTQLATCNDAAIAAPVSSSGCLAEAATSGGTEYSKLTVTTISSGPISVAAGQSISISVTITFS